MLLPCILECSVRTEQIHSVYLKQIRQEDQHFISKSQTASYYWTISKDSLVLVDDYVLQLYYQHFAIRLREKRLIHEIPEWSWNIIHISPFLFCKQKVTLILTGRLPTWVWLGERRKEQPRLARNQFSFSHTLRLPRHYSKRKIPAKNIQIFSFFVV